MCGIIGYSGLRSPLPLLVSGLERLEYRGYDSSGVAFFDDFGSLSVVRAVGKVGVLKDLVNDRSAQPGAAGRMITRPVRKRVRRDASIFFFRDSNQSTVPHFLPEMTSDPVYPGGVPPARTSGSILTRPVEFPQESCVSAQNTFECASVHFP